ncbi:MAG: methylenetetrahydrofolate reductase [NAD(P)H] [Clostridia bacterium]|nr:methylenetetrahydrofolate reductase [NAD(P)H] [Clostridia bacterium]
MKIIDIIKGDKPSFSFEVFPPKTEEIFEPVKDTALKIADLKPSYMSITYGAGGGTSKFTADIAASIQEKGVPSLAHLSCISSTKERIQEELTMLKEKGIENILALRGDIPQGMNMDHLDYHYASELAEDIKNFGGFCIGGACYPETHPDSVNAEQDIENLKKKIDCGVEFLVTQMFFSNDIMYNYMYRLLKAGIDVPVVPGIMPITNAKQVATAAKLSNSFVPQSFLRIVDRYGSNPAVMRQAGIAFATEQIIDLYANGFNAVHIYTMNKPDVAAAIMNNVSEIIK